MWYLGMGLLSLFWVWVLEGSPKGQRQWHLWINVIFIVWIWPLYVLLMLITKGEEKT